MVLDRQSACPPDSRALQVEPPLYGVMAGGAEGCGSTVASPEAQCKVPLVLHVLLGHSLQDVWCCS